MYSARAHLIDQKWH